MCGRRSVLKMVDTTVVRNIIEDTVSIFELILFLRLFAMSSI